MSSRHLGSLKAALAKLDASSVPKPVVKRPPLTATPTRSQGEHCTRRCFRHDAPAWLECDRWPFLSPYQDGCSCKNPSRGSPLP